MSYKIQELLTLRTWQMSYKIQELLTLRTWQMYYEIQDLLTLSEQLDSSPVFGGVYYAYLGFLYCVVFCCVCLHPVSCVLNAASFS
jgi:hypothetical protein